MKIAAKTALKMWAFRIQRIGIHLSNRKNLLLQHSYYSKRIVYIVG